MSREPRRGLAGGLASGRRCSAVAATGEADEPSDALLLKRIEEALRTPASFEQYAFGLRLDFEEASAEAESKLRTHVRAIWRDADLSLTGSVSRDVHTAASDIDFTLHVQGHAFYPAQWKELFDRLGKDPGTKNSELGPKAIELELYLGSLERWQRVSVVGDDRVDVDQVPMPLFQGNGNSIADNRTHAHELLEDAEYPGAKNVVRVVKSVFPFLKGFIVEALVKRVGRLSHIWKRRPQDPSGLDLCQEVFDTFLRYSPDRDAPPPSPLHYWRKAATALGQDQNRFHLESYHDSCRRAREIVATLRGIGEKYGGHADSGGTPSKDRPPAPASEVGQPMPSDGDISSRSLGMERPPALANEGGLPMPGDDGIAVRSLGMERPPALANEGGLTMPGDDGIAARSLGMERPPAPANEGGPPMPSDDDIVACLRDQSTPSKRLKVREIYLLSLGRDPSKEQMGKGVAKLMNRRLETLQGEGKVTGEGGRWTVVVD